MQPDALPLTRDEHGRLGVRVEAATVSVSVRTGLTRQELAALSPLRCAACAERAGRRARIVIDVRPDGQLDVRAFWNERQDATYAPLSVRDALARALPEAITEAQAYLRDGVSAERSGPA